VFLCLVTDLLVCLTSLEFINATGIGIKVEVDFSFSVVVSTFSHVSTRWCFAGSKTTFGFLFTPCEATSLSFDVLFIGFNDFLTNIVFFTLVILFL